MSRLSCINKDLTRAGVGALWCAAVLVSGAALPVAAAPGDVLQTDADAVARMLERNLTQRVEPGQLIVKFVESTGNAERAAAMNTMAVDAGQALSGGAVLYQLDELGAMSPQVATSRIDLMVQELSARPDVEYAQPNFIHQPLIVPNDPLYAQQWHYRTNGTGAGQSPGGIDLPAAWDQTTGSTSVVVSVIDTGVLPDHPENRGSANVIAGYDMISSVARGNDGDGRDADATDPGDASSAGECGPGSPARGSSWHGTHVAGTIGTGNTNDGQGMAGINWQARIMAVRALGKCGGSTADINDAIRWSAGLPVPGVPANPNPARVINMSLGAGAPCSASPSTQAAINDAVTAGALVVVAAGNEAQDAANAFPASCNNVVAVAAGDERGRLATRYSNFGATVDLLAPGGDVRQDADNDGNPDGVLSAVDGGYAYYNGTSMAAPHVAGVAALVLAREPGLTPAQLESRLKSTARPRSAAQCPSPCGTGLLSALNALNSQPPPQPLVLALVPVNLQVDEDETTQVTATLTRGGSAVAGATVTFSSGNAAVAGVAPPSVVTNSIGQATAVVTGVDAGSAVVSASVLGQTVSATANVTVRSPALALWSVIVLALIVALYGWRRRAGAHALSRV